MDGVDPSVWTAGPPSPLPIATGGGDIEDDENDRSALQSLEDEPVTVEDMLDVPELSQYEALPDSCRETCSG
jgi:hypothetical protein